MSVPKLRFPEFLDAEEWEEKQLHQIALPVSEKAKGKEKKTVLTLSSEYGIVSQGDYFGKRIAGKNVDRYIKISLNDFVYNDRITKLSTYGTIKRLSQYKSGLVSPIYKCFRFKESRNSVFWEWYFESGNHEISLQQLVNEGARAGRFNISIQKFLSITVYSPKSSEQQKIADCLTSIADRITAETQKLATLKAHKKGLMQQLFPAEGETLPKLRFPEFTNDWFHDVLSHHIKLISGMHLASDEYDNSEAEDKIPYFTGPSDFTNNMSEVFKWTSRNNKNFAVRGDTLLTVKGSGVGQLMFLELDEVAMGRQLMAVSATLDTGKFIFYCLAMRKQYFGALGSGNMIPGIARTDILSTKISFPKSNKEQKKIADCLSSIDDLITAQTQKIATLKTHKKGIMQQLFPNTK